MNTKTLTKYILSLLVLVSVSMFTLWALGYLAISLDDYGLVVSFRDCLCEKFGIVLVNWRM